MARNHFGTARRLPSGRYQASYWHLGERYKAPDTFEAKADALAWLAGQQTDIRRGGWIDPDSGRMSVAELAEKWLQSNPGKRGGTFTRDETILRLHIVPHVGRMPIAGVTRENIQSLVNTWTHTMKKLSRKAEAAGVKPEPLKARTIARHYDVIRALFEYAVENDWLVKTPCRKINLPEAEELSRTPLTALGIAAIAAAMPDDLWLMVPVGAVTGYRWGEVAGRRVSDVDFEESTLRVTQQLTRGLKGRMEVGPPKTKAGRRTVTMPPELTLQLRRHVDARGIGGQPDAFLFTSPDGGRLDYTNWRRRVWLPAVEAAGMTGVQFHDLRRANSTEMVHSNVDIKTAQTRLGHVDPRVTLTIYTHATAAGDVQAATALGLTFSEAIAHESRTPSADATTTQGL